jgi:hypothetical protein
MTMESQDFRAAPPAHFAQRRFLASASGSLRELARLLADSSIKVDARVGAQIAQMLRAIRETAAGYGMSEVVRVAVRIENLLMMSTTYGLAGAIHPTAELKAMFDELSRNIASASA